MYGSEFFLPANIVGDAFHYIDCSGQELQCFVMIVRQTIDHNHEAMVTEDVRFFLLLRDFFIGRFERASFFSSSN